MFRRTLLFVALAVLPAAAADPIQPHLVLLNGRAVPVANVTLNGQNYVVKTGNGDFAAGTNIPVVTVDHVFGDKPAAIDQATAELLLGNAGGAVKLLAPLLEANKDTAKLPGNFWIEAARIGAVAQAVDATAPAEVRKLVDAISAATPEQGVDPIGGLCKALAMSLEIKPAERIEALRTYASADQPAQVSAFACFYIAGIQAKAKQNAEALESYLDVSCIYPSGGMIITGVAQFKAAEMLVAQGRREEAVALANSALRFVSGTAAGDAVKKILESTK